MIGQKTIKFSDNRGYFGYYSGSTKKGCFFSCRNGIGISGYPHSCRETFRGYFTKNSNFIGFRCKYLNIKKLNEFFETIESKLKLRKKITFHPTSDEQTVLVEIPSFWRTSHTRRSLFTLFLRCGATYYGKVLNKGFNGSLNAYHLTRRTKRAINWFLDGHTKNRYENNKYAHYEGFVNNFANKTQEQIQDILIK